MGVSRALATLSLAAVCAAGVVTTSDIQVAAAADRRPNVVVIYLDDINPKTPHLWSDRARTPTLAKVSRQGVEFSNAVASTPLCGPSRATLLTGRYGHNHGVTGNNLGGFDPSVTLATRLQGVGYRTILAGKYGNGIEDVARKASDVTRYAQGWDAFDIIWQRRFEGEGLFYDYRLWTRNGVLSKGSRPTDHSTLVISKRIARHIRATPDGQPLFALVSLNSGHEPNTALARHIGSPACRGVRPYRAPSFNEKDVRDKPAYIRSLPRLRQSSFKLRSRCEEMMGVDRAVARIRKALAGTGRLANTLLFLTADNGYLLGDHRAQGTNLKYWPHAVPVPLYASWPARLGRERRLVHERVSNVDLPVTICDLAGCAMDHADGMSILPLLLGKARRLERDFVYLEMLKPWRGMPSWYGLVTTRRYSTRAAWQYVEYQSGERELYNLKDDPHRLVNLARDARQANRIKRLHDMLHAGVVGPDGVRFR